MSSPAETNTSFGARIANNLTHLIDQLFGQEDLDNHLIFATIAPVTAMITKYLICQNKLIGCTYPESQTIQSLIGTSLSLGFVKLCDSIGNKRYTDSIIRSMISSYVFFTLYEMYVQGTWNPFGLQTREDFHMSQMLRNSTWYASRNIACETSNYRDIPNVISVDADGHIIFSNTNETSTPSTAVQPQNTEQNQGTDSEPANNQTSNNSSTEQAS